MRVGLVRNAGLGMVALIGLGLVGCDDDPTDFDTDETVKITTNPSVMVLPAGVTGLLSSRTENAGNEPTWEEITATVDASCGSGVITVDVAAAYEPSIQPPGQFDVTGGTTLGETCIQLSGGGQNATVEVTVVGDSLEITSPPANDQMVVFQTHQLSAVLLSDDGQPVSPFDPTTDLTWSSDDEGVLTVDQTGLVTAEAAGAATITATWTDAGVSVSATQTITVVVPAPTLTSADAASYEYGELVTLTGSGFIPGAHVIFVDGIEVSAVLEPEIVDATTATFRMPGASSPGSVAVTVGVAGETSDPLSVDRVNNATEPANDLPNPLVSVALPVDLFGFVDGTDTDDFYEFTLTEETTFSMFLDWDSGADLDLIITNAAISAFPCFAASTAQPEEGSCTLGVGTWYLWINDYDGVPGTYHVQLTP